MNANDVIKLNEIAIKAWNDHDVEKFLSYCDPGIHWWDIASSETYVGIEGARKYFNYWLTSFPDFHMSITNTIANTDSVAVEVDCSGTNTGPLQLGSNNSIPATNKKVVGMKGTYFAKVRNGKFYVLNTYPDVVGLLTQLGLNQESMAESENRNVTT